MKRKDNVAPINPSVEHDIPLTEGQIAIMASLVMGTQEAQNRVQVCKGLMEEYAKQCIKSVGLDAESHMVNWDSKKIVRKPKAS